MEHITYIILIEIIYDYILNGPIISSSTYSFFYDPYPTGCLFFSSESGYDLPPDGHAYGRVFPRDPEGWSVGDGAESCFHGFFGHEFPMGFKH
jgi:hypothetical protein